MSPECRVTKSGSVFSKNPLVRRTLPRTGGRFPPMLNAPALAPSVQASGKALEGIEAVPGHVRHEPGEMVDRVALVDAEFEVQAVLVPDLAQHGAMQREAGLVARGVAQVPLLELRRRRGVAQPRHQVDVGEDELDDLSRPGGETARGRGR